MHTKFDLGETGDRLVYVKSVLVTELPSEVRAQAGDLKELFAVHNSDGEQLALVADRATAFFLAKEHEMTPMAVH